MTFRPLHAVLLPPGGAGGALIDPLAAALDGSGPAIAPMDGGLPRARLTALLDKFAPSAVIPPQAAQRLVPGWQADPAAPGVRPDTALVIATSGTTGQPKGAQLSAAALLASARASLRRIGASPGQRWLACLPAFHIAGVQVLVRSMLAGTAPVLCDRLDPAALEGSGCAYAALVPTQLRRLIDAGADLSALRAILLGGAAPPAGLLEDAVRAGGRVIATYGMSETCGGCVYDGVPLDAVVAEIGADGRIRIAGPVLFSGYRLRPDLTEQVLDSGWLVTSDLGSVGPGGTLVIRGRADDVITSGGEKIVAAEVESVLGGCPGVRAAAVVGRPDSEWGERVIAVVVPADPASPPALEAIRSHVRATLGAHAAPRDVRLVSEIPLLPSGKPDREALRALLG